MKVSVIYPTYKRVDICTDPLDSLLKQDLPKEDFEVIVVDNNSPDCTEEVVKRWMCKHEGQMNVRYCKELRKGDFYARNRGVEEAQGEYIVFTDDDALFDTNYLSTILDLFERYPDVGAVGTKIVIKWEGGKPNSWIKHYEYLLGALDYAPNGYLLTTKGLYLNNGSLAIKRDLYIRVGGNNPGQIDGYLIGDAEAGLCRKLHNCNVAIAFTDKTIMHHRQFVGKHDVVSDIRRRIENNGIADAYTDIYVNNIVNIKPTFPLYLQYWYYKFTFRRRKALRAYFHLCQIKKYNEYIFKYQSDENLKKMISNTKYYWEGIK